MKLCRIKPAVQNLRVQPETTVAGLPLYDSNQVAWLTSEVESAGNLRQPTFVRRARLARYGDTVHLDLLATLAAASDTLTDAAKAIGARVVDYTYGIAELPDGINYRAEESPPGCEMLIPTGYGLVAETEVLKGAVKLYQALNPALYRKMNEEFVSQMHNRNKNHQIFWADSGLDQFVAVPENTKRGHDNFEAVLPDIEPRIICYSSESLAEQRAFIAANAFRFK